MEKTELEKEEEIKWLRTALDEKEIEISKLEYQLNLKQEVATFFRERISKLENS